MKNFKMVRSLDIKNGCRLACMLTVFGVIQFFLLTLLAALAYPGGFDYFGYYFSDLARAGVVVHTRPKAKQTGHA
jgi:hypothetical protein